MIFPSKSTISPGSITILTVKIVIDYYEIPEISPNLYPQLMVKHADPWPGPESPTRIAGSAGPLARAGHVFSRACHVSRGNHPGGDSLLMFTVYCMIGLLYSKYIYICTYCSSSLF